MLLEVSIDRRAGTVTVQALRAPAGMPPKRLAATVAAAIESVLTRPPAPSSLTRTPAERPARPVAEPRPGLLPSLPVQAAPSPPAQGTRVADVDDPDATPAGVVKLPDTATDTATATSAYSAVSVAVSVAVVDAREDEPVADLGRVPALDAQRERALQLLDEGRSDAQVCAELGVSPGRLRRWDGDHRGDERVERLAHGPDTDDRRAPTPRSSSRPSRSGQGWS